MRSELTSNINMVSMNIKGTVKAVVLSLVACYSLLFTSSCSSINCPVANTVAVNYGVHNNADADDVLGDTLWIITCSGDGTELILLNRFTGRNAFSLPVSYSSPEDTLLLLVNDTTNFWTLDTLWMKKDDIPHFESVDCSAHYFHRITGVRHTHEAIDSIVIANPNVTYDPTTTHLQIYFGGRRTRQ